MNMNNMMMNNMNPMGMNNLGMNPMGMNIQPNLMNEIPMDETAQNIKSIIQPYENKIRELEEIIKQKDFEITVLKQKLKNVNKSDNFMNMNQMNMMNMNMNQNPMNLMNINPNPQNLMVNNNNYQLIDKGKEINFKVEKEGEIIEIICFEGDLASILKKKNIGRGAFTYKYKPLQNHLSLKDNGISDNTIIHFKKSMMNVVFKDNKGLTLSVVLTYDCPLGIALIYYIMEFKDLSYIMSMINNEDKIVFLFEGKSLKINDKTDISKVFKNAPWPTVNVIIK